MISANFERNQYKRRKKQQNEEKFKGLEIFKNLKIKVEEK